MPEKILGLDIGASALKAVLLSRGFRGGYRLLGFRLIDLAAAGGPAEAVKQLFADETFRGSVCVTTLPSGALSYRTLRLPFHDRRKIRQTLPFAIEPLIQTSLEDVFIDYTLTGRTDQEEIFAALAPRALVGERTALLAEYVRETAVIDIAAVPLATRLMERPDFPETAIVIDVGARETVAVFAGREQIMHIRPFPFGGEGITAAMAKAVNGEVSETEGKKRNGEIAPEASAVIRECCSRFLTELKNTQEYLLWQGSLARPPARIILTGGGSLTPGLAEGLADCFAVPVEKTDLAVKEGIEIEKSLQSSWSPALFDQALALAARPMAKGRGFNFRQRASEARAGYGEFRDRIKKAAIAALVVLILAGLEIGIDDFSTRLRLAALKRDVNTEFKKNYPEVTRIVDPISQLKGKIAETRKLSAGVGNAVSTATVLDILKEIAGLAPPDLLLISFTLDGDMIGLKGEARNFDAVDVIKKAFAKSKQFKTVTISSSNMIKKGSGVEFDLRITLKK
jgi:Tfp pilus assembly PilM family ATPase